jgi:fructose-1-phosphate kinase PfkB-like protein
MIVCIAPTPAVDRLHEVSGPVVVGAIHRPHRVVAVAGGKGLNAARAAALLGAQVRAVAARRGTGSKRSSRRPASISGG